MVQAGIVPQKNAKEGNHTLLAGQMSRRETIQVRGDLRGFSPGQAHLFVNIVHVRDHSFEFIK